jgi:hypothetical protein
MSISIDSLTKRTAPSASSSWIPEAACSEYISLLFAPFVTLSPSKHVSSRSNQHVASTIGDRCPTRIL